MLIFTMSQMPTMLTAKISRFTRFLPMGRINISATIHMPVTIRNIRSCRLILWSKISSSHFLNTQYFLLSKHTRSQKAAKNYIFSMLLQTFSYRPSSSPWFWAIYSASAFLPAASSILAHSESRSAPIVREVLFRACTLIA